jgi:hypothetical protein
VAVGGEDNEITILSQGGEVLKRFPFRFNNGNIHLLRDLSAGDTDGDGLDELLALNTHRRYALIDPRTEAGLWDRPGPHGTNYGMEEDTWLFDGRLADLDGDGRDEAAVGGFKRFNIVSPPGEILVDAKAGMSRRGYRMAHNAPVDIDGDGKLETAVLWGPDLTVFALDGTVKYHSMNPYFRSYNCIAPSPVKDRKQVLLGSIFGPDRNAYLVTFGAAKEDELYAHTGLPGYGDEILRGLYEIRRQVLAAPADPRSGKRPIQVCLGGGSPALDKIPGLKRGLDAFNKAYPYENIQFHYMVQYREGERKGQGRVLSREDLLKSAEAFERLNIPHIITLGHGTDPHLEVDTLREYLTRARKSCIAIMTTEFSAIQHVLHKPDGAYARRLWPFLNDHLLPCIDLAAELGKKTYFMNKQFFWLVPPAAKKIYPELFSDERRKWIVPYDETSSSRAPENDFIARMSLLKAGFFDFWALRVIDDQTRSGHCLEYNLCAPTPVVRHMVAGAAGGATYFGLGKLKGYLTRDHRDLVEFDEDPLNMSPYGIVAYDLLFHLLGKGLLDIPGPDTMVGLSPIAWRFEEPAEEFLHDTRTIDCINPSAPGGLFSGLVAYEPTRDHYPNRYLVGTTHHSHNFLPENRYGLPQMLPAWFESESTRALAKSWHTDGVHILEGGRKKSAEEMKDSILRSFREAKEQLPVHASNCFWMGTKRQDGVLRVTLVERNYLAPEGITSTLSARGGFASVRDVLTGDVIAMDGDSCEVDIPAGAFRILDVVPR